MNGVAAVVQLLVNDAAVIALAPADADPPRISADELGENVEPPAIDVSSISDVPLTKQVVGDKRFVRERVQVRAHAANIPGLVALTKAVRNACDGGRPTVSGIENVYVAYEGAGPQGVSEMTGVRARTLDFMVTFTEAA